MNQLRPIKPSLSEKTRYIAFEAITEQNLSLKDAKELIMTSASQLLGILGMAKAGIMVVRNKYDNNKGVIRVNRKYVDHIKASLTLINKPNIIFRSLKVTGTINT